MSPSVARIRLWTLVSLVVLVPAGFWTKFYSGPGREWVNNSVGGVLYEVFWILVVYFWVPKRDWIWPSALGVFLLTCALEVLQLWKPPLLQAMRSTFLGSVLLGTTFVWSDFFCYAVGSGLGALWARALCGGLVLV